MNLIEGTVFMNQRSIYIIESRFKLDENKFFVRNYDRREHFYEPSNKRFKIGTKPFYSTEVMTREHIIKKIEDQEWEHLESRLNQEPVVGCVTKSGKHLR